MTRMFHRITPKSMAGPPFVLAMMLCVLAAPAQQSEPLQPGAELPAAIRTPGEIRFKTSNFTFVRVRHANASWTTDFPAADRRFSAWVENRTGLSADPDGLVLQLTDPKLSQYPFIYIVEGGRMSLDDAEVASLRNYLLSGGFLMVDDFWGEQEWESLAAELRRVFPDREPFELSTDHDIFRAFYEFREKPQVPSVAALRFGGTSERADAQEARYLGLHDDTGRLVAVLCHNSDFGDSWELEPSTVYPREYSQGRGIPMGINIVVYALSH